MLENNETQETQRKKIIDLMSVDEPNLFPKNYHAITTKNLKQPLLDQESIFSGYSNSKFNFFNKRVGTATSLKSSLPTTSHQKNRTRLAQSAVRNRVIGGQTQARFGNVTWYGKEGFKLLGQERQALSSLRSKKIPVDN